ncbi:MAG TPA: immunoglobulin domain-containing protein, partial [Verrucomicrobiae bacterium]|nr:immunoglobulin domain-containing protein [Verrucomicrobiae bacterium]
MKTFRKSVCAWLRFWLVLIAWDWNSPSQGAEVSYFCDESGNLTLVTNAVASAPNILAQPVSAVTQVSANASFAVSVVGLRPLAFQWQFNSNNIPNATSDTLFLTNISATDFGAYRVLVSNAGGSVTSSNALLQLDSDRDGMADAWEIAHFGNITNQSGFGDLDLDGVSDRDEFLEGTDPKSVSSGNPRLTIFSDFGQVFVSPNVPLFTNGQTVTLTGIPDPGLQSLGYLGQPTSGGPFYSLRTNPAPLRFGAPGVNGSQVVRAIFGLPLDFALNVTNAWRIDQAGWYGQTNVTHDGVAAAQSSRILGAAEALLELSNVTLSKEGTITFWWKVDGTDRDLLQFRRNNLLRSGAIGTNTDWQQRTYYLPAGVNVVRWEYVKHSDQVSEYNGMLYAPADAGWVDEVSYAPWPDAAIDSDGDGLPDIWEYKYFDTLAYGPHDDPDGDGTDNLTEYLDGTDPTSNASLLPRLTVLGTGGTVTRNPDLPKYTIGQTVQLQAVPDPTNYFVIWSGAVSGTNITNSIYMNGNKTISATFGLPLGYVLDAPSLPWTRGGVIGFFGQTNFSHDGLHSAQAGPVGLRQESSMLTSVAGPATLVFWWKASSLTNQSVGRFLIDGVEQTGSISGETPWLAESFFLGAGNHTLKWTYTNNTGIVSLTNGIWVDQVAYTPGTVAPSIAEQPLDALAPAGGTASFHVTATGTPPLAYQWFRNNVSLGPTATNSTLTLSNLAVAQAGTYRVDVSNSAQTTPSRNATLTVLPVPPLNDNFVNATVLSSTNPVLGYTFGATSETGEPYHAFVLGGHSVWWSWTAPTSGDFRLSLVATNMDTPLAAAVYTGTAVAALTSVSSGLGSSFIVGTDTISVDSFVFSAQAGTRYSLAVDHGGVTDGFLSLAIAPSSRPVIGVSAVASGGVFGFDFNAPP